MVHRKKPNIIPNLINDLTYRNNKININNTGYGKSIIKCTNLNFIRNSLFYSNWFNFLKLNLTYSLHCNHYKLISEKYFKDVKCLRGGGQSGLSKNYKLDHFYIENKLYNESYR